MIKIRLHSSVNLITNSSTVIFTYSEGSLQAVKDLVNEMLKVFDRPETFDDIFYSAVFLDSPISYLESESCPKKFTSGNWKENEEKFKAFLSSVLKGEVKKPEWMNIVEDEADDWYRKDTSLYLVAKDEKYSELANKLLNYLYSTDHEATRDG